MRKKPPNKKVSFFSGRQDLLLALCIFVVALAVRLIYLLQIESSLPFFHAPIMDELYHDTWAQQIASGQWVGEQPFFRAPLYVYLLALTYKVFGHSLLIPRMLQIIMGSLSCVLVFLIAKKLFNRTVAIISGLIAAFCATLIFYDGQLLITSLIVFLDLLVVSLLIRADERPKPLNWLVCGAVLGLSAIARPTILMFVPFILLWRFFGLKKKTSPKVILTRWIVLCAGVLLFVIPVTLRNYSVGRDLVLIAWNGGYNFYLGNNPQATGWSATAPPIDKTWWGGYKDAIRLAEQETGRKLKPSQISSFWYGKGIDFVMSQPLSWLKLMIKKTGYLWKGFEISNTQNIYLYKGFSSIFDLLLGKFIVYYPFGLLAPFSLLGLFICLSRFKKYLLLYLFILSYSASVIFFFVCSRYRMPIIPFLIMFGSFSLWWLYHKIRNRQVMPVVVSLVILVLLWAGLNTQLERLIGPQAFLDHYVLGITYQNLGKLDQAILEYRTSLTYNPDYAASRNNLANLYDKMGKTSLAITEYKTAIRLDPSYEKPYYNLAVIFHNGGDLDRAIQYYLQALEVNPYYELARLNLGRAYHKKGLAEEARKEWRRVLELNPGNREAARLLEGP